MGDTSGIKDVVDQLETDRMLFGKEETKRGTVYNTGVDYNEDDDDQAEGDIIATSPDRLRKMKLGIPAYVEDQLHTSEK